MNQAVDFRLVSLGTHDDLGHDAVILSFDVHGRLVSLDLEDDISCGERVSLFHLPGRDPTLGHGRRHGGHLEFGQRQGHGGRVEGYIAIVQGSACDTDR